MLALVMTPFTSVVPLPLLPVNTYYFGKTDGKDTLSFGAFTAGAGLTIAVDAAYGATSGIQFSGDLGSPRQVLLAPSPSTMLNLVLTGTLFLNNVTGAVGCWCWSDQHHIRNRLDSYDHCSRLIGLTIKK